MKPRITIRLFGRFSVRRGDQELLIRSSSKAKEILAYLAVNRRAPVPRETLANLIAPDSSEEKSRKALRQALWQLREGLAGGGDGDGPRTLNVDSHWAQVAPGNQVWIDVHEFERSSRIPAERQEGLRSPGDVESLRHAVQLYRGELLQGWYREWCLTERERLKQIYLEALDRLLAHLEADHNVESGVAYATLALRADPARECTHRALMRLYCIAGDRASAIRQYERCVEILHAELGMRPDDETQALERSIRAGHSVSGSQLSDRQIPPAALHAGHKGARTEVRLPPRRK
jgi:DNA-binding SARP family transcriptional activator